MLLSSLRLVTNVSAMRLKKVKGSLPTFALQGGAMAFLYL